MRKTHSIWDRTKRTWNSELTLSKNSKFTVGSQFEKDLEADVVSCQALDDKNMEVEHKFQTKTSLTDANITDAVARTREIMEAIKRGNRIVSHLRSWRAYDPTAAAAPKRQRR